MKFVKNTSEGSYNREAYDVFTDEGTHVGFVRKRREHYGNIAGCGTYTYWDGFGLDRERVVRSESTRRDAAAKLASACAKCGATDNTFKADDGRTLCVMSYDCNARAARKQVA